MEVSPLLVVQSMLLMKYHVHTLHDYTVNHNGEIVGLKVLQEKLHELRDVMGEHGWLASIVEDSGNMYDYIAS